MKEIGVGFDYRNRAFSAVEAEKLGLLSKTIHGDRLFGCRQYQRARCVWVQACPHPFAKSCVSRRLFILLTKILSSVAKAADHLQCMSRDVAALTTKASSLLCMLMFTLPQDVEKSIRGMKSQ